MPASLPSTHTTTTDTLQPLLLLQAFDGSWEWSEALQRALSISSVDLQAGNDIPVKIFATLLSVAFLRVNLAARAEEWTLVAAKACAWVREAGYDPEVLMPEVMSQLQP